MDVSELLKVAKPQPLIATKTVYARIPEELFNKLRRRSVELSEKGKKVTQQDIIISALKDHLD